MKLRKGNKRVLYSLLIAIGLLMVGGVVGDAFAQSNPARPIHQNPFFPNYEPEQICDYKVVNGQRVYYQGVTSRFVNCIRDTVDWALERYLRTYIGYFVSTINIMMVFAVILFGVFTLTGRAAPASREAIILAIKIGVIVFLINQTQYANLFPLLTASINWLVELVTGYTMVNLPAIDHNRQCITATSMWDRIDCVLQMMIGGIYDTIEDNGVEVGLIGIILAMLFSKGVGIGIFLFGAAILLSTLLTILHAMFILISAYIALALLSLLAPIMIPLILFKQTKAYFEKWLRLMIGVMLQPIFLFAYLAIFLIALEVSIFSGPYSVYRAIACNGNEVWDRNFSVGRMVFESGAIQERAGPAAIWSMLVGQDENFRGTPEAAEAQRMDGGVAGGLAIGEGSNLHDRNEVRVDPDNIFSHRNNPNAIAVDLRTEGIRIEMLSNRCTPAVTSTEYIMRVVLSFFSAAAVLYVFYTMLSVIPYLGTLISGDLFGLPNLSNMMPTKSIHGSEFMGRLGFGRFRGGGQ